VAFRGRKGNYTLCMFLDDHPPIAGGRELWGFPKKLGSPTLRAEADTLIGTLDYGSVRVATGTMGYKHRALDTASVPSRPLCTQLPPQRSSRTSTAAPVSARLVEYYQEGIEVKGAWTGPAALSLIAALPWHRSRNLPVPGGGCGSAHRGGSNALGWEETLPSERVGAWAGADGYVDYAGGHR